MHLHLGTLRGQRSLGEVVLCAGLKEQTGIVPMLHRYLSILVEMMERVHCNVDQGFHNALIYSGEQSLVYWYSQLWWPAAPPLLSPEGSPHQLL